jgi:predicted transcriptional regulator
MEKVWCIRMITKHEQIITHIQTLEVGNKISVRQIAKALDVSEGTAYRAIKDAETQGFVSTIGRVGTIRIEKKQKENIEKLTFAEVVNIVDGTVIGGREGLYKTLNKFVVGAMELEAMMKYVDAGNLLIVGNRRRAHKLAIQHGAPVLVTGGFGTTDEVKELADELELPIISSSYDTFTVAAMINRAIDDRLIKKEIMTVEDILISLEKTFYLKSTDTLEEWYKHSEVTKHSRYPVVDEHLKIQGVVTGKDIIGSKPTLTIEKVMTKHPICVSKKTSVASAAHIMIWEGIELLPVVDSQRRLLGIISRQDVLKALQYIQKQPQIGETFEDLITSQFEEVCDDHGFHLKGEISPQMTNHIGTISSGVLTTLLTDAGNKALRHHKKGDLIAENLSIYFLKPVQIESIIEIHPQVLELSRKFGKVDIEVFHEGQLVAKALMTAQLIDRS